MKVRSVADWSGTRVRWVFAIGLLVGLGIGGLSSLVTSRPGSRHPVAAHELRDDRPERAPLRYRVARVRPAALVTPSGVCTDIEEERDAVVTELAFCHDLIAAQMGSWVGYPQEWPFSVSTEYRPDAVKAALEDAAASCPGASADHFILDCEEFPCIAFQYVPEDTPASRGLYDCDAWPYGFTRLLDRELPGGDRIIGVAVAPPGWCRGEVCANYDKRWDFRTKVGLEIARDTWDSSREAGAQ